MHWIFISLAIIGAIVWLVNMISAASDNKKSNYSSPVSYSSKSYTPYHANILGDKYSDVVNFLFTLDDRYRIVENTYNRLTMRLISQELRSNIVMSLSGNYLSIKCTFENDWSSPQTINWDFDCNMNQRQMIARMNNDLNKMAMDSMYPY